MRFLDLPVPVFTAVLVPQIDTSVMNTPAWIGVFFAGFFTFGWFLDRYQKLPGAANKQAAGFGDVDRRKLEDVHAIVMTEDADKPRWPRVWAPIAETLRIEALLEELTALRTQWEIERAEWKVERTEWKAERGRMERRITELEDVVRRQEHALEMRGS